jgi:23S rRNA maturation-related 3'-5' exoribonuclease YhaM
MSQGVKHELLSTKVPGNVFAGTYLVESVSEKTTSTGKKFTDLIIRDKSGSRPLKYWGTMIDIKRGDFITTLISVENYQGNASFTSNDAAKEKAPADLSNHVASFDNLDKTLSDFNGFIEKVKSLEGSETTCSKLLSEVFSGPFFEKFKTVPGSVSPCYGKIGGNLVRTVRIATNADFLGSSRGFSSREQARLITAALIHRCGGAVAFRFDCGMPEYTEEGMLIGVSTLSAFRFKSAVDSLKGKIDWKGTGLPIMHSIEASIGSGIKPMTFEAIVLSQSSKADFQLSEAQDFIGNDGNHIEGSFSSFDPTLRRKFYYTEDHRDNSLPNDSE